MFGYVIHLRFFFQKFPIISLKIALKLLSKMQKIKKFKKLFSDKNSMRTTTMLDLAILNK